MLRFKFLLPPSSLSPAVSAFGITVVPGSNLEMCIMEFYVSAGM